MSAVDGRNLAPVYAPPDPPSTQCWRLFFSILGDLPKNQHWTRGSREWFDSKTSPVGWCKILAINRCKKVWSAVLCMRWRRSARQAFNEKSHGARSPFTAVVSPDNVANSGCEHLVGCFDGPSVCGFSRSSRHDTPDLPHFNKVVVELVELVETRRRTCCELTYNL